MLPLNPTCDGYVDNHFLPSYLVLNLAHAVREFRAKLATLPMEREVYIEHYVSDVFCYVYDADNADGYLEQFQHDTVERLSDSYPPLVLQQFSDVLAQFCNALEQQLMEIGAWDDNGVLWFQFDRLVGDDIVLRRVEASQVGSINNGPVFGRT